MSQPARIAGQRDCAAADEQRARYRDRGRTFLQQQHGAHYRNERAGAAREISILVAAFLGTRLLAERDAARRLAAAAAMVAGIICLALG